MNPAACMLWPCPGDLPMNTSTTILLPLITSMCLLTSNGASAIAADTNVTSPSMIRTTTPSEFASSTTALFTPVPYRRSVRTSSPVRVASLQSEQVRHSDKQPRLADTRTTGTVGFVKQAVLQRVAEHKASQTKDLFVPQPRDLELRVPTTTGSSELSVAIDSRPYVPSQSARNRKPIDFHSTVGIRAFH
jgi:hypothetical protein